MLGLSKRFVAAGAWKTPPGASSSDFTWKKFLVHSWRSIRRLIYLVAISFYWLNLWGKDSYTPLRDAFDQPSVAVAQEGNLLVRLASDPNQSFSAPKTQNPAHRLLQHWVNSKLRHVGCVPARTP